MKTSGNLNSSLLGILLISTLGCGSSNPDPEPPPPPPPTNQAPIVSVANQTGTEKSSITITSQASDSDGSISSYSWTQVSGPSVTLDDAAASSVTFVAPEVVATEEIQLSVTVTDDDGATASAQATVTINANMVNVVVNGLVTDSPIAGAHVELSVGSQKFSTVADQNGLYSVDLSVDDSFVSQFVTATATGPETDSSVKLVSILGTYEDLVSNAGDDQTLDKNELFAVNITNVSTAVAALMEDANGNQPIVDATTFEQAAKIYDGSRVLPLATAIKLVIDYSADNAELALPEGVTDTMAFVADINLVSDYVSSAQANFADEFNSAQTAIINDKEVISGGTNDSSVSIADSYYFISPNGTTRDGRMTLNSDGTGSISEYTGTYDIEWAQAEEGIEIAYPSGERVVSESFEYIEGIQDLVEVHVISTGKVIQWINQSAEADQLMVTDFTYRHFPNGEAADEASISTETFHNAIKTAGVLNAADILLMEKVYAFPVPLVYDDIENPKSEGVIFGTLEYRRWSTKMVFSGTVEAGGNVTVTSKAISGEGTISNDSQVMQWNIDENGHLIVSGNKSYDYAFLLENEGKTPYVNVLATEGEKSSAGSDNVLLKEVATWTNETAVGIYDLPWDFFEPLTYFWIEVNADGTALTVSSNDSNSDGVLTDDEFFLAPGLWQIDSNGSLVVRRYRENSLNGGSFAYCTPASWEPADSDDCVLWHERDWDLHQVTTDEKYYMDHIHRFYEDAGRGWMQDQTVTGHILGYAATDIRYWLKVDERPIAIPGTALTSNVSKSKMHNNLEMID